MECSECPVKGLCDCGVKPKSCPKNKPPDNPFGNNEDVMKMFNDLFGGKKK